MLDDGPSLSGIVVDDTGAGASGVTITGWPANHGGRYAEARTKPDGTFVMGLGTAVPYLLDIGREPRFEPWAWDQDASVRTFAPGTKDIRIVLVRSVVTTFHVIDSTTRAPIERFGLRVSKLPRWGEAKRSGSMALEPSDSPGGTTEEKATPGRTYVVVTAAGYAPAEADVAHDAGSPGHMTIAMRRASRLKGRLEVDGAPLSDATVQIENESIGHHQRSIPTRTDLESYAGREQKRRTGSDGAFEFEDLAGGTYVMRIEGPALARTVLHDLAVPGGETLDLGAVDVGRGAVLRVRFITAANESAVGFGVWVDGEAGARPEGREGRRRSRVPRTSSRGATLSCGRGTAIRAGRRTIHG